MKKITIFSLFIAFSILTNTAFSQSWVDKMQDPSVNFYEVQKAFNKYYKHKEEEFRKEEKREREKLAKQNAKQNSVIPAKGEKNASTEEEKELPGGWEIYKRWEDQMKYRLYPSGDRSVMTNAWNEYLDNFYSSNPNSGNKQLITQGSALQGVQTANWSLIGPSTSIPSGGGAGRVNFVRFDPTNTNTIYVGSPGGGLWKSTTGGTAWTTNTDNLAVIGCTDLAINPTNTQIMYLATGDGEAQDTYSIGVLKSTNGGTSWSPSGLNWAVTNIRTISRLLMNPQNPNTIFAATSNGVYRTLNAGATWTQIASTVASIKDIEYKPGDTTTVYAASTTKFYKSTNGGTSFVTTATGLPATTALSRLAIAVTAANSSYVYVLASNTAYGFQGLYRSIDNGTTFTSRSTTPNVLGWASAGNDTGGQGWYDLSIAASPTNADLIVVGGVNIWKSTTGGTSWTLNAHWTGSGAPYVHADIHALEFLPASATTYFAGCDGGFFKTSNTGGAWSDLSNGLQISQAYKLGLSKTNASLLVTGFQDNGTNRWSGTASWTWPLGGDGMEALVDWSNASIQYGELYYGEIRKTTTGGNMSTTIVSSGGTGVNADGDWVTPYIEAPSNAATLFVGKAQVYKSTTSGTSWAQVGTISGGTGNLIALANAASNINYIYAAKIDKFYVSTNGTSFTDRTTGLPTASAAITYIAVHPTNPSRVWVTFSGYSAANKVWYSADAGVTWTNYSTGLPNLPANCIVYQDNSTNEALYVGTDVGVYYRDNTAGSWAAYNTGLPNVSVRELEIQYTALKLRAATFGRGIWQSDLNTPATSPPTADFTANQTTICTGQCVSFTDISNGAPTSWSWSFPGASTTSSTIQNPTNICYNTAGTYNVTLIATNANGNNTMAKTAYITVSGTTVLPLTEGFQATFVPAGWLLNNPDADNTWSQTSTAGGFGTSSSCILMDNYSPTTTTAGRIDEILTPKYSFSGISTATLTFDVAYARYNATYKDSLRVLVSTDCGTTWNSMYSKGGSTGLQTAADNGTSAFVPAATEWRTETISLTPYAGLANVMVKFQHYSGWGQLMYLDNINITGAGAAVASVLIAQTTGTNPMCAGQSATFTATPTNGGTAPVYQWKVNGVNVGTNSPTYTTTTLTTGQIVTCVMTSNLAGVTGSPATSNSITMTVNPVPATPTATNTGAYCAGATISLATPAVTGATYAWTGPGAFTSALQNPTRTGSTTAMAGTYSVTITVSGCTSLAGTTAVVVNAIPATPTATNTGPYCTGTTITLATPTVAGATYAWTGPNTFSSALQNPTIASSTTAMAGTYSVTITVAGCTSLAGTTTVVVNAIPATPTATNTGPYCTGTTITLATPTVAGATYAWTGPSAFTSTLQNPTRTGATAAMAGTYSVTITVAGCTSLAGTTTVVVNAAPATPTATNTGPYCTGTTITLATPTVAGATYTWTGPSAFTSTLQNPTRTGATIAMAGTYSVTITVAGCTSLAGTTIVVVNAAPATPTATNTGPYCTGTTITLATPTVAGATYAWTGPSAFTSTLQNPTRTGATTAMAGTYSVTITVAGCTSLAGTTTVVVNAAPATPTATNTGPYCTGTTITLATPTVAGATYAWTGPSAFTSALQNPTRTGATTAMAGTYSVTITVGGCTSSAGTTVVTVNTAPATPTASSNTPVCAFSTLTLSTPTVTGATYSWTGPSTFSSTLQNPTRTNASSAMAGTYSVTVTVGGCTSPAGTTSVIVNPGVAPSVSITANPTGAICSGTAVTFTAIATNGGTAPGYQWKVNGSNVGTNSTTYTSSTLTNGQIVTCALTSNALCATPATVTSNSITMTVTTTVTPSIAIAVTSGSNPSCTGSPVTFTATPANGGTTPVYQWQINGSNVGTNSSTYTSSALATGQIVTCILTSNAVCAGTTTATSNAITMTVNTSLVPSVTIAVSSGANPSCTGASVTFTASPTNGGTTPAYQWQVDGVNNGTNSSTYSSTSLTSGQVVSCIMTSNSSCASPSTGTSNSITMTVNPLPVLSITNPAAVCSPGTIDITAPAITSGSTGGGTLTYWTNAGATTALASPNSVSSSGTYYIKTTTSGGCIDIKPVTVTINSAPVLLITNPTAVCSPLCVDLTVPAVTAGSTGGGTLTYWTNSSATTALNAPNNVCSSGTYYIKSTTAAGCLNIKPVTVTINSIPTPTISQAGSVLTSSSATGNQWYLDGAIIPGATSQNYTFTANGNYTVVVTTGSCSSQASSPISITTVGITDVSDIDFLNVYPNPSDGNFEISFNSILKSTYKIELINALGQQIFKEVLNDYVGSYSKQLSVVDYGKGVYTITLTNAQNETVKKIIVY